MRREKVRKGRERKGEGVAEMRGRRENIDRKGNEKGEETRRGERAIKVRKKGIKGKRTDLTERKRVKEGERKRLSKEETRRDEKAKERKEEGKGKERK